MNKHKLVILIGMISIALVFITSTYFLGHFFGGNKIISAKEDIEKSASTTETHDKEKITNKS